MANILTRAYNSTLGIPQQILYRLWRAAKDDEIDVLSREGLLAPELLPVLGIGFSHESDATVEDVIGEQGFGKSLAADILLDPATYLTAGASAIGKAGRGLQIASRDKKFGKAFADFVGDTKQYDTGQALAAHVSQGIADGTLKGKSAQKALQGLQGASDETLEKILRSGKDEELLFSIPGLSRLGAKWRAPELIQQQGSWFKAMSNLFYKQKLGLAKPLDWTVAQTASAINKIPGGEGLNKAVATAAGLPGAFTKGFKSTKGAANELVFGKEVSADAHAWNDEFGSIGTAFSKVDADQFQDDVAAAIAGGADAEQAAYKAARKQNVGKTEVDALLGSYGDAPDPNLSKLFRSDLKESFKLSDAEASATSALAEHFGLLDGRLQVGEGGIDALYQSAYHGSPHKFDKFDARKIGSGEGVQAFGHGLYFTEQEGIAEHYRKALTRGSGEFDGKRADSVVRDLRLNMMAADSVGRKVLLSRTADKLERRISKAAQVKAQAEYVAAKVLSKHGRLTPKAVAAELERLGAVATQADVKAAEAGLKFKRAGRTFEVDLAPAPDEYLLWDKPFSEQSEKVQAALDSAGGALGKLRRKLGSGTGEALYRALAKKRGGQAEASKILREAGVRGIKYLSGPARKQGKGAHNFVIFDDADVTIKRMFQDDKGVASFAEDGKAFIQGLNNPDASTAIHEVSHVLRRRMFETPERFNLQAADKQVLESWAGVKEGNWTRDAEETFARGFERYVRDGVLPKGAPTAIRQVFDTLAKAMRKVYQAVIGTGADAGLPKEVKEVFDNLMVNGGRKQNLDNVGSLISDLQRQHQEVQGALKDGTTQAVRTDRYKVPKEYADHPFSAWAWKAGDWAGEQVRSKLRSDAPITSDNIEGALEKLKNLQGLTDMSARDTLRIFDTIKRRLSADNDIELETIDRFWFSWQQAFPHSQEIRANIAALQSGDLSSGQAAYRQLTEFVNRFDSSATSLLKHSGVQDLEDMVKVLDPSTAGRLVGPHAESIKLMAKDVTDPAAVKDLLRKNLGSMSVADLKRLRSVTKDPKLKARLKNIEKRTKKGKPVSIEESIERGLGKAKFGGKPLKEGPAMAMADYVLATRDIKRALKAARKTGEPVRLSPLTVERLEKAQDAMQSVLKDTAAKVFKKSKAEDIDGLIGLSDNVANQAAKLNGFERGAVIGYAPRIHNRKFRQRYEKLIGKVQSRLGANDEVDAMFRRVQERDLTVEDLNLLREEMIRNDMPDLVEELTDVAGNFAERPYVESWEAGILTRMSQQGSQVATRQFINDVFSNPEAAAKDGVMGGRVTRLIDSQGQTIKTGADRVKVGGTESATIKREALAKEVEPSLIEIQLPNGEYQLLDLRQHKARFDKQGLQVLGTEGDDLGQAMIRHEARMGGKIDNMTPQEGSWIIAGEGGVVDFLRQSAIPQKSEMAGAVAVYDWVNFNIKKFQTVFRASHHAGNLLSGIAQTRAAGASWANTALGHLDSARIMGLAGPDGVKAIDDMSALSSSGGPAWKIVNRAADRAKIVEGLIAGKTVDELGEFATIDFGLHSYGAGEIMQRAAGRNLFGGIQAIEDIKLGGIDSQGIIKQQEKLRGGKATQAFETALDASRAPEITARTSTLFALLREGHTLDDAIDIAKLAHVDYSSLTKFERTKLKRMIPYYTFSRKYVPFALERMAKDPSLIVAWQKTVENADWAGIDENGTPVLSKGRFEMDLGRVNANLDAMMALAGTTEMLFGTMSSEIQQVQRPGFASLSGGALSPLATMSGIGSEEGASLPQGLQEFWDSVFVTRWAEGITQAARGEGGAKLQDALTNFMLPARLNAEPDKARQFQLNTARRALRRLELQAQEATSDRQLASLQRQAAEIRQAIQTVQQDFGS